VRVRVWVGGGCGGGGFAVDAPPDEEGVGGTVESPSPVMHPYVLAGKDTATRQQVCVCVPGRVLSVRARARACGCSACCTQHVPAGVSPPPPLHGRAMFTSRWAC
jgi:hypothetical protein